MNYWKEIKVNDTLKPGDILKCDSPVIKNIVIVKEFSMTGVTTVRWIRYGHMDGIEGYWTLGYIVEYCKKLIDI